jgi:hypothetical protein
MIRLLRKDNWIKLGSCVENKINELFPGESEKYVGFRPKSVIEETDDESF